jgi:serine/threonine protein kinase
VTLGIALAEALHELHQRDLVHRDIKPSNVIFVNDAPKLADVGLIAPVAGARSYVGTEGFIAPEGPNSRQGDIYSLGKLLYEVSTGKDRTDFPTLPPDLAAEKDFLELNEVLVKACDADLRHRYQTVKEMESDLSLLQSGDSVRRLRRLERVVSVLKKVTVAAFIVLPLLALAYLQYDYQQKKAAEIIWLTAHMRSSMVIMAAPCHRFCRRPCWTARTRAVRARIVCASGRCWNDARNWCKCSFTIRPIWITRSFPPRKTWY